MTPSQDRKHKGSILVIGDEFASLKLLLTLLTEDGYAVHERQPELGSHLRVVKDTLPDLVLVDVRRSDIDGYRVCAGLKNDPTTRAIPVIFISSIDRSVNQAKALVSGAVDYVTDPFDAEEVLWRIETHISLRRLREDLKSAACNQGAQPVAPNGDLEKAFREIHVLTQVTGRKHAEEKVRQAARELKKAQEALQSSQRNLSLMINVIPTFIHVLGTNGCVLDVNQAVLDYTGLTLEDVRKEDYHGRVFHPDDVERLREERAEALLRPIPFENEQRVLGKDGKYRWFLIRYNPLLDEQQRIDRWYVAAFDIEDRKRAEDAQVRQAGVRADVSAAFSNPIHLGEILRGCTEAIVCHLDAAFARIWTLSKDESMLELQASSGMYTRLDGSYSRIPGGDLKVGSIAREKKAHLTNDVMNDPRVHDKRWAQDNGMVAFAGYPLLVEDRLIGVVALFARRTLSESILDTIASVADTIAQGIERKRAEEALRRSEASLAEAQRLSKTGSFAWSPATDTTYYSEECYRVLGFEPQAGPPPVEAVWQRVHPDDQARCREVVAKAMRDKVDFEVDYRIVHPDKKVRDIHGVGHVVLDGSGEIVGHVGTVVDITERKRAEEALRNALDQIQKSESKLRQVIDAIPALAWCNLPDGPNEFLNKGWHEYTGLSAEESHGRSWQNAFHPDDLPPLMEKWMKMLTSGEPDEIEARLRRHDGVYRWFLIRAQPFRDESGKIVRWYGTSTDIDDRKKAEEAVRRSEKQLRDVIETMPAMAFTVLPDGSTEFVNRRFTEYTGLTAEEIGLHRRNTVHPEDIEGHINKWQASLASGKPFENEVRHRGKDGQYRWFLVRGLPLRDEDGNILKWFATMTDIEDRKQAEERLRNENVVLREEIVNTSMFEEIVGTSAVLQSVLARVAKVAPTDSTVLITGETGTGKELIARAIHKKSQRSGRAFVSVNCAAIPRELIASELFGHEKGAFTGAVQRRLGRFELAEGGTIFLDEIGELPAETQIALLRVLQEREFERVGGTKVIRADVRVIAATNRDLQASIDAGTFRNDLYYRLNIFPIDVPPLRKRKEDIPPLVAYLIDRHSNKVGKKIRGTDSATLNRLLAYPWPGNVRELQNVIERSIILCETDNFTVDESWLSRRLDETDQASRTLFKIPVSEEKKTIEAALAEAQGRVSGPSGAAAKLGVPPSTLDSKIKALKINKHRFKTV